MGDRIPGLFGVEPPTPGIRGGGGFAPPDAGFDEPGPIGADAGAGAPAGLTMGGWPRTLSWGDFPGVEARPPGANDESAQIHSEVDQPERVSVTRSGGQRRVSSLTVTIRIVREDTWVVNSQKTAELLSHEQGHYNITGLMGRDMGNEILAARAGTLADLQQQVTRIIERYRQRSQALSDQYDTETRNGRDRDAQRRWDDRIRQSMDQGTPFSAP